MLCKQTDVLAKANSFWQKVCHDSVEENMIMWDLRKSSVEHDENEEVSGGLIKQVFKGMVINFVFIWK